MRCYFTPNRSFRLPEDGACPIIMIGPGTGIAPFRAFLEEREFRSHKGPAWLFFGAPHAESDFYYEDELTGFQKRDVLTRMDVAFSRDQDHKIYVQDRMRENGAEIFSWLEKGAYVFVCGDAKRMAKDVDMTLHDIIKEHSALSHEDSTQYVARLSKDKRYVRDVY